MNENAIEGRNAVIEAFRAGKTIDKLYVQDGLKDGPIQTILREAKKHDVKVNFEENVYTLDINTSYNYNGGTYKVHAIFTLTPKKN